ncbi:uncharacterized protein CPUR_02535 [Claviceps purpurea 20.1]|uniref:Methyltransferase n=1 Tax=Claviceps purpurea (strain 20.1) TaxID=1111077 RepID=M1W052_CLAP2|nr:uncharacterized protein CPUR_02535 [Claviceps purpurea 20.1]
MSNKAQAHAPSPPHTGNDLIAAEDIPVNDQDEIDSVFSQDQSSTTSIASSVLEYRQIHGRTYHSDKFTANYFLPNDDQQLETEEICHHYLTILLDDQLFLAPLEKDKMHRVLDVGTGFGIWAIEFADQFPNASVVGTDLSPCQPRWVPPNLEFEIDDATLEWTWDTNHFDFVHMRYIVGGIQDWGALFKEASRCCTPGGWVESIEYDVEFRSDDGTTELEPVLASFVELFREASKILKRPLYVQEIQPQALDEAGFIDKKIVRYKLPIGATQMFWQSVQKPEDEYHEWLATIRKAIRNPKVHSYMMVQAVYGRKPE